MLYFKNIKSRNDVINSHQALQKYKHIVVRTKIAEVKCPAFKTGKELLTSNC